MKIYFAWITEEEDFDPVRHGVEEEDILSLVLTEKEGQFPLVTLELCAQKMLSNTFKNWCFISYDKGEGVHLLFKGRRSTVPQVLQKEIIKLNFIAQPSTWEEDLQTLHHRLKQTDLWDPLFIEESAQDDPLENLEGRSALYYWCRRTHKIHLSDLFWGSQRTELTDQVFYENLKISLGEPPLTEVQVVLSAEWIQHYRGRTDLSPLFNRAFPEGIINTLTGEALEASWWKETQKISGYTIVKSHLKEITPSYTGLLNLYPASSDPIWIAPDDPAFEGSTLTQPLQRRLNRRWYQGCLEVEWFYRQKRREKVTFTLKHSLLFPTEKRSRRLTLNLQDLFSTEALPTWRPDWYYQASSQVLFQGYIYRCAQPHRSREFFEDLYWHRTNKKPGFVFSPYQGRFFTTDRGIKTIEQALERAKAHLAGSARSIEIKAKGPLAHFLSLTCDHSVRLQDDRLPGGEAWGKVKELKIVLDGQTGKEWAEITLGVSLGREIEASKTSIIESSYRLDYAEPAYSSLLRSGVTPSGIKYSFSQTQGNSCFWLYPKALTALDIVESLRVENTAFQQNNYLLEHQYPQSHDIERNLKEVPTRFFLKLRNLSGEKKEVDHFTVNITEPWSAPAHLKSTS